MSLAQYDNPVKWRYKIPTSIVLAILSFLTSFSLASDHRDLFFEDLYIKPLNDGKLFAHFQFKTIYRKDIGSLRWENNFQLFPLSIAELVASADLDELHFSLTKGNWNSHDWGYLSSSSPPGAQIRVQLSRYNESPDRSWRRLINSLAGKFCTSLVSADEKTLVKTRIAFRHNFSSLPNSTRQHLYANLPEGTFCTENLTPWKKLLPCHSSSGLASLLNAVNILKSSYSSLSIDIEPLSNISDSSDSVQLTQLLTVVFNPLLLFEGKQTWSLSKLFGNNIHYKCPVASHSRIHVDITNLDQSAKLYPNSYVEHKVVRKISTSSAETRTYAVYDINSILGNSTQMNKAQFNLGIKQNQLFKRTSESIKYKTPIDLKTHVAGLNGREGTIVANIANNHDQPVRVNYMDVLPYFLRVYLHTLTIRTSSRQELRPDQLNFALSKDVTPTLIELSMVIPPASSAQISYEFERAFLRWTDYKPDANKGILIGSAMVSFSFEPRLQHLAFPIKAMDSDTELKIHDPEIQVVYAKPLLIILPMPDLSMPYNVICLVCTVVVIAIGQLHNMTTTKPMIRVKKQRTEKVEEKDVIG